MRIRDSSGRFVKDKRVGLRRCLKCGSGKTLVNKDGIPYWNKFEDGWICNKCRCKLYHPEYAVKALSFKDKTIHLKQNPRKGVCQRCGKQGVTDIHHTQYHEDDPLKDTVELCVSCHTKESWRLGQMNPVKRTKWIHGQTFY